MNLFSLHVDVLSFIFGFILASVLWWAIQAARPAGRQARETLRQRRLEAREKTASGIEERYRRIALRQAQGMHLAASLFSLEEIIEPPRLLAPPARIEPGMAPHTDDIVSETVPYMPAWPELASAYGAPTLTLPQALSGGTNIAVIGQPGCGKTIALAHLATQVINRHPDAQTLHDSIPFLIHIADVDLPLKNAAEPLHSFIEQVAEQVTVRDLPRTPGFVKSSFESGRALLLLDGLDELAPGPMHEAADLVRAVLKTYPRTRVICTGAPEHINGLIALGFVPLSVATWNEADQERLLGRWSLLWTKYVSHETWAQSKLQQVDPGLLDVWLTTDNAGLTPLEYTLKIWGGYAGDVRGPGPLDAIEMQIRRLAPGNIPAEALQTLGMQAIANTSAIFDSSTARKWVKSFDIEELAAEAAPSSDGAGAPDAEEDPTAESELGLEIDEQGASADGKKTAGGDKAAQGKTVSVKGPPASLLNRLAESGLLASHRGNRLRFSHPVFGGYLAGRGLAGFGTGKQMSKQPAWSGRSLAMRYFAAHGEATPIYEALTGPEDPLLERGVLSAARWLRDAPRQTSWRAKLMPRLVDILQTGVALGLRAQALTALALSGDPSAAELFRQLLQAPSPDLRALAALGCGMTRDGKAVEALKDLIKDHDPLVRRAASLALVRIGAHSGLLALATVLQQADEDSRRAAAEALANNPVEGWETLREGAGSQDILLRRAAVFGLARVEEPWAMETLEKIQVQDEQWVVRTLAVEFVEARQRPSPRVPHKLTAPADTAWIIEFAGRYGMGVTPGQPATDLLLLALKSDKEDERRAALNYLRYTPGEGVLAALFGCIYGPDPDLREAAYYLIWEMSVTGAKVPAPQQFGLG